MKQLALMSALVAAPAFAHEGHPEATGPFGHEIAHLALAAGAIVAVYVGLEALRKVVAWLRER